VSWKIAILLVWAALPLSAWLMLRADYQRYQAEGQLQLERSEAWEAHLWDYVRQAAILGREVDGFDTQYQRNSWEGRWRQLERQRIADEQTLGLLQFDHYPATETVLRESAALCQQQRRGYQDASRAQDSYIAASESLDLILEDIRQLEGVARYWQYQGRFGVYLQLQDELARRESIYHERRSARNNLYAQVRDNLKLALESGKQAELALSGIDDQRQADASRTYKQHLAARYRAFDLRRALRELLTGSTATAGPGPAQPGAAASI
jgi:hypothetical protein